MVLLEQIKPIHCIICNDEHFEGIQLLDQFICTSCEQEMVQTDVDDPKYLYYVYQLRSILPESI
jgi:hypothetical protein